MRLNGLGGILDVTQIRLPVFIQGRGHTNDDGIHFAQLREVRSGVEMAAVNVLLNLVRLNVLDVRLAGIQHVNFFGIGVKTGDLVPGLCKTKRQRESDVAASDNANLQLGTFEKLWLSVRRHVRDLSS
jgi:hypothetical protein